MHNIRGKIYFYPVDHELAFKYTLFTLNHYEIKAGLEPHCTTATVATVSLQHPATHTSLYGRSVNTVYCGEFKELLSVTAVPK